MKTESLSANREPLTGRALTEGQRMAEIGAGGLPVWGNGSEAGAAEEFGSKSVDTAI